GDDAGDAGAADGDGSDLAGRAAAEVGAGDHDVARRHLLRPTLVVGHSLQRVLAQLFLVQRVDRVLGRDDLVRVDVVAELPGAAAHDLRERHEKLLPIYGEVAPQAPEGPVSVIEFPPASSRAPRWGA